MVKPVEEAPVAPTPRTLERRPRDLRSVAGADALARVYAAAYLGIATQGSGGNTSFVCEREARDAVLEFVKLIQQPVED